MRLTYIAADATVIIDGQARTLADHQPLEGIGMIDWANDGGYIEWSDGITPNTRIDSLEPYHGLVAAWADARPAAPPEPATPQYTGIASISRPQLILALATVGLITPAEAEAAATVGAVPANINAVFSTLPAADALAARVIWATMTRVERSDPLVCALIAAGLASANDVDGLFTLGASI
jgi:hypothetical protein